MEAYKGLVELMNLCPDISLILIAHAISGIIRAAFEEARFTPNTILTIIGKSGTLKSHYVPLLVQLYNRKDYIGPATRFNSTNRFIEDMLCDYRECTAVIDDIHTGESASIMRANKNTAEDIVRRVSDNTGRGRKEGNESVQRQFHGNVVFIGEYTFGRASTVPRTLMLNLAQVPDGGILDKYQRKQPLLVSTFYYYFIQWYVENFNDICNLIDTNLSKFRTQNVQPSVHRRFLDTQFYLQISYWIFLLYCRDSCLCPNEEVKSEYACFEKQLCQIITQNQEQLDANEDPSKDADYLKIIRKLYQNDKFNLASDIKQFNSSNYDGLIYYECLCLRGERIDAEIRKKVYNADRKDWVKFLECKNALKIEGGGKKSVQISGGHGVRFYAIYLNKLK